MITDFAINTGFCRNASYNLQGDDMLAIANTNTARYAYGMIMEQRKEISF